MNEVRVRIAPSPTGIPHIGNTRTALFNYLFAKHYNGKFILRIEDTDRKRLVKEAGKAILEILDWLGIKSDETYIQSERIEIYKKYSEELLSKKIGYANEGAIWIKVPKEKIFTWNDLIGNKKISFKSEFIEDFVIIKSDGFPTYHFANVVDDHLMKITHVIRGDEWISSTPKHLYLYEAFGWNAPHFAHLPVILGTDKTKLSKRHGAESVLYFRSQGYLKETLLNFMVLLGWNPGNNQEIIDFETMVKLFDLKDVNTGSPIFDLKKLDWMNGEYIRKYQISNLKSQILNFCSDLNEVDDKQLEKLLILAQTRVRTLKDFGELILPFVKYDKSSHNKNNSNLKKELKNDLEKIDNWKKDKINEAIRNFLNKNGLKYPQLYEIIINRTSGLPIADTVEALGKNNTLELLS